MNRTVYTRINHSQAFESMGKRHLSEDFIQNSPNCAMHSYRNGTHIRPNALRANKRSLCFKNCFDFEWILSLDSNPNQRLLCTIFFYFGYGKSSVRFFARNDAFEVTFREQIIRLVPISKTYHFFACHLDTFNPKISDWLCVRECSGAEHVVR